MNPPSFRGFDDTRVESAQQRGVEFIEATHCWDIGPHFSACVRGIAVVNEEALFFKVASTSLGVGNRSAQANSKKSPRD